MVGRKYMVMGMAIGMVGVTVRGKVVTPWIWWELPAVMFDTVQQASLRMAFFWSQSIARRYCRTLQESTTCSVAHVV